MLLGNFSVEIIDSGRSGFLDMVPLLLIDGHFSFGATELGNIGRAWSTHYLHVLLWLHKDFYLDLNIGWTA